MTTPRGSLAAAAAALVFLGLLGAAAPSPAAAPGDERRDDWHDGWHPGGPHWDRGPSGWNRWSRSRPSDPLAWVRHSRHRFQQVMRKLARRSAGVPPGLPPRVPQGVPPGAASRPEPDWGPEQLPDRLAERPSRPPGRPGPDGPWSPEQRTAEPGRDRTRVKEWHRTWSPSCRRAGVPVEGAGWYVVAPGDTLWRIAWVHYGNSRAWRGILRANWEAIRDPDVIYACQRLLIPGWGVEPIPCDDAPALPPRRACHRPRCDDPATPPRSECGRPPPQLPQQPGRGGPGGCSRCGAGSNAGARGWR